MTRDRASQMLRPMQAFGGCAAGLAYKQSNR
jgi:hypothetical protein